MDMPVNTEHLAKAGEDRGDLRRILRPLLPGAKNPGQGSVGEDEERDAGVQAGQFPGQAVAAGLTQMKDRARGTGAPGGVETQHLEDGFRFSVFGFRKKI
jgi:hypothetical protein